MIRALSLLLPLSSVVLCAPIAEKTVRHASASFKVVRTVPEDIQVVWKGADGIPYRTFDRVQAAFSKQGKTVRFIMNAGIFEPGGIPTGLHVESSTVLHPLNLANAPGNFFLKPNGVIWIEGVGTNPQ